MKIAYYPQSRWHFRRRQSGGTLRHAPGESPLLHDNPEPLRHCGRELHKGLSSGSEEESKSESRQEERVLPSQRGSVSTPDRDLDQAEQEDQRGERGRISDAQQETPRQIRIREKSPFQQGERQDCREDAKREEARRHPCPECPCSEHDAQDAEVGACHDHPLPCPAVHPETPQNP